MLNCFLFYIKEILHKISNNAYQLEDCFRNDD